MTQLSSLKSLWLKQLSNTASGDNLDKFNKLDHIFKKSKKNFDDNLQKINNTFEIFLETKLLPNQALSSLLQKRYFYLLMKKKQESINSYLAKNKKLIEEYEDKLKRLEDENIEIAKYYEELDKKQLEFFIEYERKKREIAIINSEIIKLELAFQKWNTALIKLSEWFLEVEKIIKEYIDEEYSLTSIYDIGKIKSDLWINLIFDWKASLSYKFDSSRIEWENSWIQMFSQVSTWIFWFFDEIKGEELLDPLVKMILSSYPEVNEDTFSNIFLDFIRSGRKHDIDIFWSDSNLSKSMLFRDYLMWFNACVFFRWESYLYIFEYDNKKFFVKLKADSWNCVSGELPDFKNDSDCEDFLTNHLKITVKS